MILKKYPSAVESQWHKSIADAAFSAAQLAGAMSHAQPQYSCHIRSEKTLPRRGRRACLFFRYRTRSPHRRSEIIPAQAVKKDEVGDKQIDEAIYQTRFYFAQWKPIADRGVQEGDYIMIDLDTIEGEPQKVFDHVRFQVIQRAHG